MRNDLFQSAITIPYRVLPGSGNVLWPIVEVKLSTRHGSIPQPLSALIDSGASSSVLHPFVAEVLGFDFKNAGTPHRGTSVSGTYNSWKLPFLVELTIFGYTFRRSFTVINNPHLLWPCILGQDSIFEVARIDFYKFKSYFELRFRTDIH